MRALLLHLRLSGYRETLWQTQRHHRDSKVWRGLSHEFNVRRGLSHEFGVVRLYGTFSIYIIAGETRCAGCFSLSTSLQGKQGVHGAYALVQGGSSTSNHFITEIARCGEF